MERCYLRELIPIKSFFIYFLFLTLSLYGKEEKDRVCNFTAVFYNTLLEYPTTNNAPGEIDVQPYLYGGSVYGDFNNNWSLDTSNSYGFLLPQAYVYIGVTERLQVTFFFESQTIFFREHSKTHFGDSSVGLGFQLLWEKPHTPIPNIRFGLIETFPTGAYQRLDPNFFGNDATGAGSYITTLLFIINKTLYGNSCHPFNLNAYFTYSLPTKTTVHGINIYGGGLHTRGVMAPGDVFVFDFSIEYCISQSYLFGLDFQYIHAFQSSFHGFKGINPDGTSAFIETASRDLFAILPAIEFGLTPNICLYLGGYFTPFGRNSPATASAVTALEMSF